METTVSTNPIDKLAEALAKAQSEIKAPVKDRHVDFTHNGQRTKYSYADLANVLDAVREPLTKNSLSVVHQLTYNGEMYGLQTTLMHSSGQSISSWYPLPDPGKQQIKAQAFGSALTYARRYSLCSIVGIAADEDDDGATAPETQPPKPFTNRQSGPSPQNNPPMQKALDKAPVKNYAPGASNTTDESDDLDKALDKPPMTTLEKIYAIVDERGWSPEIAKEKIRLCLGVSKSTTQFTPEDSEKFYKYLTMTSK